VEMSKRRAAKAKKEIDRSLTVALGIGGTLFSSGLVSYYAFGLYGRLPDDIGIYREGMQDYSSDDVRSNRNWCYFREGVYDLSLIRKHHPGGAWWISWIEAGNAEFWMKLLYYKHSENAYHWLEQHRLGNVKDWYMTKHVERSYAADRDGNQASRTPRFQNTGPVQSERGSYVR